MRHVDPEVVEMITSMSSVRNNEEVFFIFGLSYNTLRKLSAGQPIRRSLADRIEERARKFAESEELCSVRSEEHTSELQSLMRISYAVFCLKKKTNKEASQQ